MLSFPFASEPVTTTLNVLEFSIIPCSLRLKKPSAGFMSIVKVPVKLVSGKPLILY
jgi:hypothetical protein